MFLVILSLYVFVYLKNEDEENVEIDVTVTDFEYDVAICDDYFELIGCIIDRDTNQSRDSEMKNELKNQIKNRQEEWKQLNEEELVQKCRVEYENLKKNLNEENVSSFGCLTEIN